jgi:hypothetical protein
VQESEAVDSAYDAGSGAGSTECVTSGAGERRADDRRCRNEYVFRDKRSGFDRRTRPVGGARGVLHGMLVHLRDNPMHLWALLLVVNILNLTDFGLTVNAMANGASEANPVMASLFKVGPLWAGVFKTVAIVVATALVWECRRYRKALIAAVGMLLVFAAIFIYHMIGITLLS